MAKVVGLGIVKITEVLKKLKPDIVFVNADRFEMMAVALAAAYLNIPIAHNEAGDVSGTIDESIRHAITKFAQIHFTATEMSTKRVIQMGENPDHVFTIGSPAIDAVKDLAIRISDNLLPGLDISKPYLLVLLHPVATESPETNYRMAQNLFSVLKTLALPAVVVGSNFDAMSSEVGKLIRALRQEQDKRLLMVKNLPPENFYTLLALAACAVGNSSSFIREGGYFGTPVVLIGSRQQHRERSNNVLEVNLEPVEIQRAIERQLKHGRYSISLLFGDGTAGRKIADILATVQPEIQKKFYDD
jgi:UDP-hydrolysing UDP-N-acetyl-D-glucosamine 2-epimerase